MDKSFQKRFEALQGDENNYAFAEKCGVSEGTIRNCRKGIVPGLKSLSKIADAHNITLGNLLGSDSPPNITEPVQKDDELKNADLVPVIYMKDTYASAGGGVINYDQGRQVMSFDRSFLSSELGVRQFDNLHVVHAVGDSMQEGINPGDLLFINPGEQEVVTGAIYVLVIGEETMVKRAERNPLSGELILRSDNKKYDPIRINEDDLDRVRVIGRVIGNFRKC